MPTSFPISTVPASFSTKSSFEATPPPPHLVSGAKFWRPRGALRSAAATARSAPNQVLALAVRWLTASQHDESRDLAFAVADLVRTGRAANVQYKAWCQGQAPTLQRLGIENTVDSQRALEQLLRRLDAVQAHLEHVGHRSRFEPPHGVAWIASVSEVDTPRRPVNVGMTDTHQREFVVRLRDEDQGLAIRWTVRGDPKTAQGFVIYLPGLGSRAEEADGIGVELAKRGYLVASFDHPSHAYSSGLPIDKSVALDYGSDGDCKAGFPYIERMTEFGARIVAKIEAEVGRPADCLMGGSLGATISMRLSMRRDATRPRAIAIWSPAGLWGPMNADPAKLFVAVAPRRVEAAGPEFDDPRGPLPGITDDDGDGKFPLGRETYFGFNFEKQADQSKNVDRWWGPTFRNTDAGQSHIRAALTDRLEIYSERVRRLQCRLAYEQLCFSIHRNGLDALIGGDDASGRRPVLLMCGTKDNDMGAHIFDNSAKLAHRLEARGHKGGAVWFEGAGHSIHDECPDQVAAAVDAFLKANG